MVEHPTLAGVVLSRDVDACLLVEPPVGQSEVVRDMPGFLDHHPVRHECCVDVTGDARGVLGQGHGSAADHEYVRDDTPAGQALAQGGESAFHLGPAEKDIVSFGHAASRS
jgi:azurin